MVYKRAFIKIHHNFIFQFNVLDYYTFIYFFLFCLDGQINLAKSCWSDNFCEEVHRSCDELGGQFNKDECKNCTGEYCNGSISDWRNNPYFLYNLIYRLCEKC